jgi:hypothetical protein
MCVKLQRMHAENTPLLLRIVRGLHKRIDKIQNGDNIKIYLNIYLLEEEVLTCLQMG